MSDSSAAVVCGCLAISDASGILCMLDFNGSNCLRQSCLSGISGISGTSGALSVSTSRVQDTAGIKLF